MRKEPVCPVSPGLIFTGPQCQHNTRFITMATLQYFITIHTAACDSGDEFAGAGTRILESWLHDDLTDDIMYGRYTDSPVVSDQLISDRSQGQQ